MLAADLLQAKQVALGRHQHTGGAGDRLDDDRGDGGRVMQRHQSLQLVGELGAVLRLPAGERIALKVVGVGQVVDAVHERPEQLAVGDHAAHRDAAEAHPVIAALAADEARARALAAHALRGDGDLERRVHRLRARVAEEHVVEVAGHQCRQPRRQLEGAGMAHLEGRRVVHARHLVLHRLDDLGAAVAGIDAPHAGGAVEHLAPVGVGVVHVLGRDQHARMALEVPVGGERHPVGPQIVGHVGHGSGNGGGGAV